MKMKPIHQKKNIKKFKKSSIFALKNQQLTCKILQVSQNAYA